MATARPAHPLAWLLTALMMLFASACSGETGDTGAVNTGEFDKASLRAALEEYDRYFEARDFDTLLDIGMPEVLIAEFMEQENISGVDIEEFKTYAAREMETAFESLEVVEYKTDLDKAQIRTTETGRPYAMIPTRMELRMQSARIRVEVDMLAVVEKGRWYFLNPADEMSINAFKSAMPDLAPLKIKPQKTTVISR